MGNSNNVISGNYTFFFADTHDIILNVISVSFTDTGAFDTLTYMDGDEEKTLTPEEYTYTELLLDIPGVGYAYAGDIVYLEQFRKQPTQFELHFGWHENVSNQKLFSWYLKPTPESNVDYVKTLYYGDLTNIVGVNHITEGNLILDNRYTPPYEYLNEFIKIIGVLFDNFTIDETGLCTVVDLNGRSHTLTPTYDNGAITGLLYDGYPVALTFDDSGCITNVGGATFDISAYHGEDE